MVDNQDPANVQIFDSRPPIEESERRRVLMTNVQPPTQAVVSD